MSAQAKGADLRAWLEEAIFSADAALSPNPPGIAGTGKAAKASETVVASSNTEAEISAESAESADAVEAAELALVRAEVPSHHRKLATIRRIAAVMEVDDEHDVVTIDGWKVIAEKAEKFSRGEYVLFLEIDSFLLAGSEFEEWFVDIGPPITFKGETGYRVGTSVWTDKHDNDIISQGHVFRLADFPDIDAKVCDLHWDHIDETEEEFANFLREIDFSDEFGVKKWESFPEIVHETPDSDMDMPAPKPENLKAPVSVPKTKDNTRSIVTSNPKPPSFIIKADMERVQNCPNLFTKPKYQNFVFQESVKMDGSTMTIYFITNDSNMDMPSLPTLDHTNEHTFLKHALHPNGRLGVCTRAQDLLPHLLPSKSVPSHNLFWATTLAANLHNILPAENRNLAIQAELVGATIQGNPHHYPETPSGPAHELLVFAITEFTACTSKRLHPRKVETFARKHGLKHVPVLGYHTIPSIARNHQDLVVRAELKRAEGLVFKNCTDERWFKVLSNRWILEKGDEMHAARAAQGGKKGGKKKGKGKGGVKNEVLAPQQATVRHWVASPEEVKIIHAIFKDLKEWIWRDDGLKKWMEEWNMGFHGSPGGAEDVEGRAGVSGQETDGTGMMEGGGQTSGKAAGANSTAIDSTGTNSTVTTYTDTTTTRAESATTCAAANSAGLPSAAPRATTSQSTKKTGVLGVSEVKRHELADWLGVEGFGL